MISNPLGCELLIVSSCFIPPRGLAPLGTASPPRRKGGTDAVRLGRKASAPGFAFGVVTHDAVAPRLPDHAGLPGRFLPRPTPAPPMATAGRRRKIQSSNTPSPGATGLRRGGGARLSRPRAGQRPTRPARRRATGAPRTKSHTPCLSGTAGSAVSGPNDRSGVSPAPSPRPAAGRSGDAG